MNSLMRRSQSNVDQMHSFLKDKQAWENAIAMYNGPDPLDHWYNYVCWYDNNIHGDPENKFRETLERCLTLFEHNEYYKQDNRMVKLWIKYIDMQPNPLNFYQVLYQRGIGRQCTSFYVNWAHYYSSLNAFKEAESVYNLGFQAKAQPFVDLQNAHSKFIYSLSQRMIYEEKQQHEQQQIQQQQQQHEQQQQQQQCVQQTISKVEESLPQTQQMNAAASHYQLQQQQQQQQLQHLPQNHQSEATFNYNQHHNHLQQNHLAESPMQHQQFHHTDQQYHPNHHHLSSYIDQRNTTAAAAISTSLNYIYTETPQRNPVNEANQQPEMVQIEEQFVAEQAQETPVDGIQLPANFATYCRNNYEIWKPALFLEEPPDPNRCCQYAKDQVYPGNGIEYSPEEIKARQWETSLKIMEQQEQILTNVDDDDDDDVKSSNVQLTKQHKKQMKIDAEVTEEATTETYSTSSVTSVAPSSADHDIEDQIEASTIRFSMHSAEGVTKNKTIKIKFKKENRPRDDSVNGEQSYSYSIDTNYQPSEDKFEKSRSIANNNGNFHPYSSQTSTPKIKRSKKLKDINKFYVSTCSNSNSSDYLAAGITMTTTTAATTTTLTTPTTTANANNSNNVNNYNYFDTKLLVNFSRDRRESSTTASECERIELKNQMATNTTTTTTASKSSSATTTTTTTSSFNYNNDNANFSFNESNCFDNSNCSVASAVDRLNFRETPQRYNVENDISTYAENSYFASENNREMQERRLQKALETIDKHLGKSAIDPFNSELCRAFLTKLNFPSTDHTATDNLCKIINNPLPKFTNTRQVTLADVRYNIEKEVGRGSYGSVHKAIDTTNGCVVALKYQKPPNIWEIYICNEVMQRMKSPTILPGIMDISSAVIAPNASIIATEFSPYGSLLDINNKIRQATKKVMHESLVMHFSSQILNIVHHLHSSKIIHADIKPDNFLLMRVPNTDLHYPSLRLIDFGCAIDMTLFPNRTQFRKVIQTDGFTCIEMQEGRPWSYETDLFCIAGTVHVMLFGEYMQLNKKFDTWDIKQKLPRYLKKHVWTEFFSRLLNIKNQENLPNLLEMKMLFDEEAMKMDSELQNQIRTLSNLLHRR